MTRFLLLIMVFVSSISNLPEKIIEGKEIYFSGMKWKVRNTLTRQGPGPNYFDERSAWVDEKGFLHLYLHKDSTSGKWLCAEITSEEEFQYGTYSFLVEGPIDKLDKNIVLGLFNYSGHDGYDEIDIEFARWGNTKYPNLNYTVWPAEAPFKNNSFVKEYSQKNDLSIQEFTWKKGSVIFSAFDGDSKSKNDLAATYNCISPPASISDLEMPVHINLWLFDGSPPLDNKPVEIIIRNFNFQK
jgi:hypothetical protein